MKTKLLLLVSTVMQSFAKNAATIYTVKESGRHTVLFKWKTPPLPHQNHQNQDLRMRMMKKVPVLSQLVSLGVCKLQIS